MSKNTNLSFLTDFLTADIVNSRVGMNNASPQSTFDVTGTGKFSGILTLGSTVSNGTYTYTLPSATGTLALTSDIPVVTGYVPYTGATTSVDLGDNVLTSGGLNIDSLGGYGGALNLRQATSFSLWTGAPYTSIYATTGNRVVFMFSNDNRTFTLDGSLVSAASPRTFTFPDATGTFALTSQIPTNAVGGTGTLNTIPKFTAATTIGNSNIFDSGSIIYNTNPAAGTFAWQFNGSTVTGQSYGAQVIAGTNASDTGFRVMNAAASINYLVVRGDGLVTLTGALNGTSATFGGLITGQTTSNATITQNFLAYNSGTSISGASYDFASGGTAQTARISANYEASSPDRMAMRFLVGQGSGLVELLKLYNNTMTVTGAATFSSTITTTGANINGDVLITNSSNAQIGLNTTGALNSVGAYLYFNRSGSNKWTAGMGPYTGSNNYEIVTGSVVALSLAVTTGAATFSSSVTAKGTGNYNGFIADNSSSSTIGGGYYAAHSFGIQRGIFGVAGAVSGTTDNNIGIFAEGGLGIKFFVNGSATASHMMTSGGNVLIGTTTDNGSKLQVSGTATVSGSITGSSNSNTFGNASLSGKAVIIQAGSTNQAIMFKNSAGGDATLFINGTSTTVDYNFNTYSVGDALVIKNNGSVGIGTSTPYGLASSLLALVGSGSTYNFLNIQDLVNANNAAFIQFINSAGSGIGGITRVGTTNAVLYSTSSDYRLKEDLQEIKGLEVLSAIKVYNYKWKDHESRMDGVLAHELAEVLPYAVHGEKDAVDENGNDKMQGVDYGKIVPILIKAIQEQQEQIQELKNKLS